MASTLKQEVLGSKGVVSTNHPLASLAGIEMLANGGNAIDSAMQCGAAYSLTLSPIIRYSWPASYSINVAGEFSS